MSLPLAGEPPAQLWWRLPTESRGAVLTLLARLIARGVVEETDGGRDG